MKKQPAPGKSAVAEGVPEGKGAAAAHSLPNRRFDIVVAAAVCVFPRRVFLFVGGITAGLIIVAPGPFNSPVDHPAKQFVHLFMLRTPL